ncbi:MAG: glycosyltransferase, partial [Actinomycetes bacterium]
AQVVAELQARDPRVELVTNERRSIPSALNVGLRAARGRWLVRVDAHSTVPPGYVSRAVARLSEGRWGGVGGRKDGSGSTATGRAIAAAMASRFGVGNSTYHHGTSECEVDHVPFGAYPVELVRDLRGWDERLLANEDFEFDYRLRQSGRSLLFDPSLVIQWHSRQTVRDLFRQYFRYGRGKVDVAALHPTSLQPRHALPPAFVAYGAGATLIALRRPGTAGLMISPYAVGVLAASVSAGRRLRCSSERMRVPLAFVAMHVGWGAGFWAGARDAVALRAAPVSASPPAGSGS